MTLEIIGTGSSGNCYLLTVENQTLVIEAGVKFTKFKKSVNFDLSRIVGVLCTHAHGDHAELIPILSKFGKNIYCTTGTANDLNLKKWHSLPYSRPREIGIFKIISFETFHEGSEPCGFIIEFNDKRLAFITDTTHIKTKLENIDYWLIEANYSKTKLIESELNIIVRQRIINSHMSIDMCASILNASGGEKSELVILIHGSEKHSDKKEFLTKIPYAIIAENGQKFEL